MATFVTEKMTTLVGLDPEQAIVDLAAVAEAKDAYPKATRCASPVSPFASAPGWAFSDRSCLPSIEAA